MTRPLVVRAGLLGAVVALAFQVFLRYEYVHQGYVIYRVDRLTQETCEAQPTNMCDPRVAEEARNRAPLVAPTMMPLRPSALPTPIVLPSFPPART